MNEDTIYRTSTQFKHWSFTPTQLTAHRKNTNELTSARIRTALLTSPPSEDLTPLTPAEENTLLTYHISLLPSLSAPLALPSPVRITAAQYLRRFYLFHSPLLHPLKTLTFAALFLATKTENHIIPLSSFVGAVPQGRKRVGEEEVRQAEGVLVRGLRFGLAVWGGGRGLEGGGMELFAIAAGKGPGMTEDEAREARRRMEELPPAPAALGTGEEGPGGVDTRTRIRNAHTRAKTLLTGPAQLTDLYFLYPPAQIWLGALWLADEILTAFYLSVRKLNAGVKGQKLVSALRRIADMLAEAEAQGVDLEEARRVGRRLYFIEKAMSTATATAAAGEPGTGSGTGTPTLGGRGKKNGAEEGGSASTEEEGRERGGKKIKLEVEREEGARREVERDGLVFGGKLPRR